MHETGYLSIPDIRFYYRAVKHVGESLGHEMPAEETFILELLDMAHPRTPERITLHDLVECKLGPTFLHCLTDLRGYWAYENRENAIHEGHLEQGQMLSLPSGAGKIQRIV